MERGLSFLEFNYMIMQSYDFYYLSEHYGCNMRSAATTNGRICSSAPISFAKRPARTLTP